MTQPNLLNLAKQGDTRALTSLLNRSLQARGITAKATKRNENLHILLEAQETPSQAASVRCIQQGLVKLSLVNMPVTIYGRKQGETSVAWQEHLTTPIDHHSQEDSLFDAELLEDGDASGSLTSAAGGMAAGTTAAASEALILDDELPLPTMGDSMGGEPTQASEDWSDQATAIEMADPLPQAPPPPGGQPVVPPPASSGGEASPGGNWDNFDLDAEVSPSAALGQTTGFEPPEDSWGTGMPVDYSPEDPEPTLIVPDEEDEEMEAALNDEDADSEILLSLWDDANLDDDIESSGDISVDNLELWQEGDAAEQENAEGSVLSNEPMFVGDPSASKKSREKKSSCLPLLLLGLAALLAGIAAAAHLQFLKVPLLAKIPGVGPFLAPKGELEGSGDEGSQAGDEQLSASETTDSGDGSDGSGQPTDSDENEGQGLEDESGQNGEMQADEQADGAAETDVGDNAGDIDTETDVPPVVESTTTAPSTTPEPEPSGEAPEAAPINPFRDAVNAATQASTLAQTAVTVEEWGRVADYWSSAVTNMKAVPDDHPRYDLAQEKIPEYQRYQDYAEQQL